MNPKIDPEVALKTVDAFLTEIEEKRLIENDYTEGSKDLGKIIKEIEGLIRATFADNKERISQYHLRYPYASGMKVDRQVRYISRVKRTKDNLLSLKKELSLYIASKGEVTKTEITPPSDAPKLYIEKVEQLALRDINNYDVNIYLNALIKVIQESEDIPPEEKENLIEKIKNIANNPYVAGIGAGIILEAIKTGLVGK